MPPPTHALILTAGLGTRLRPLTFVRAKPAIPVAGVPLICRIIDWLVRHEVSDLVLNLHHLPQTLTAVVGDGADRGARVRYSWEQPEVLGSGGGPRRALPLMDDDPFFIVNGDTLTDLDLRRLAAAHAASGALATLALVANHDPHKYGGVRLDRDRRVIGFVPRGSAAEGSYHFIGVQVAAAGAFASVPDGQVINSFGDVYTKLIESRPGSIGGFVSEAAFQDIGTTADYWATSFGALSGGTPEQAYGIGTRIAAGARVSRSILWDDVHVGADAMIDECIVTDGVEVAPGSAYRRSVLRLDNRQLVVTPL
jgi:NDP-sugar pyrophosphorylase family protein